MKECNCKETKPVCKHDWQDKGVHQEVSYQSGSLGGSMPNWVIFMFCKKCHVLKKIYATVSSSLGGERG
jgi:hypothetical protein